MSYGDNPTNVAKGKFGENLVCYTLSEQGWEVVPQPLKTDENPSSIVDIKATRYDKTIFVEVKTKNAFYWSDYFPVYTLETWKVNRFLELENQTGIEVWLAVVDSSHGGIFWAKISDLIKPCVYQAYQFPVRHFQQKNQIINDYFHIEQFALLKMLTPDTQRYLGKYFDRDEFAPQKELGSDDMNDCSELEHENCNDDAEEHIDQDEFDFDPQEFDEYADGTSNTTSDDSEYPFIKRLNEVLRPVGFLPKYSDLSIPIFVSADNELLVGLNDIGKMIGYASTFNLSTCCKNIQAANIVLIRAKRFKGGWEKRNTKFYFFVQDVKNFLEAYCAENCRTNKRTSKYERYVAAKQLQNAWDALVAKFKGTPADNTAVTETDALPTLPCTSQPTEQPTQTLKATTKAALIEGFANAYKIPVDEVKRFVIAAKCKTDPMLAELFGYLA